MKLEQCTPGSRVYVAGRYLLTQLNCVAEVIETRQPWTREQAEAAGFEWSENCYPHGMVQIRLPDTVQWGCRIPWIGPEDLAPYPLFGEQP